MNKLEFIWQLRKYRIRLKENFIDDFVYKYLLKDLIKRYTDHLDMILL